MHTFWVFTSNKFSIKIHREPTGAYVKCLEDFVYVRLIHRVDPELFLLLESDVAIPNPLSQTSDSNHVFFSINSASISSKNDINSYSKQLSFWIWVIQTRSTSCLFKSHFVSNAWFQHRGDCFNPYRLRFKQHTRFSWLDSTNPSGCLMHSILLRGRQWIQSDVSITCFARADLGGCFSSWSTSSNFFFLNEQAKKLIEAVVQVQLHFIYIYGQWKAKVIVNIFQELLYSSKLSLRSKSLEAAKIKYSNRTVNYIHH